MDGRQTLSMTLACLLLTMVAGCGSNQQAGAEDHSEETTMTEPFEHGLRCDPMDFVANGTGLPAALVRAQVFGRPRPGDAATIEAHFAEVFADLRSPASRSFGTLTHAEDADTGHGQAPTGPDARATQTSTEAGRGPSARPGGAAATCPAPDGIIAGPRRALRPLGRSAREPDSRPRSAREVSNGR